MASYLITGASRGLGLALTELLAAKPSSEVKLIFATARKTSPQLEKLVSESTGRVIPVELELTDEESIEKAVTKVESIVGENGLDVLVNNAAILNTTPDGIEKMDDLMYTTNINVNSVHLTIKHFLPLLRKGQLKKIIGLTSSMGSITLAGSYMFLSTPAYKISKAALNMLLKQYAIALADEGFTVTSINPGWVKTDMGTDAADLPIDVGSNALLDRILKITKEDNGKFLDTYVPTWKPNGSPNIYDGSVLAF